MRDMRGNLPVRAGATPYPRRDVRYVDKVNVHYTASAGGSVRDIAAYQVGPNAQLDFPAIAYHFLIELDGTANWCTDLDVRVWGSDGPGQNETAVHVCYVGDIRPNLAQIEGIAEAIAFAQAQLRKQLDIYGHKDFSATACPGAAWPGWKPALLVRLRAPLSTEDQLRTALGYVCDDLGDRLRKIAGLKGTPQWGDAPKLIGDVAAELARVGKQYSVGRNAK